MHVVKRTRHNGTATTERANRRSFKKKGLVGGSIFELLNHTPLLDLGVGYLTVIVRKRVQYRRIVGWLKLRDNAQAL